MIPPCPRCSKDFKNNRDRQAHINKRIPCVPEVVQNIDPLPSGSINRQDYVSLHQSQVPSGSQVPRVIQIPDQQNSISHDEVRELDASVKELVSQLCVLIWNLTSMSEQFKDVRGALTILSDQ